MPCGFPWKSPPLNSFCKCHEWGGRRDSQDKTDYYPDTCGYTLGCDLPPQFRPPKQRHTRTAASQTRRQFNNLLRELDVLLVEILGAGTQDIALPVLGCQENQFSHWHGIKTEGGPGFRIFYARQENQVEPLWSHREQPSL